MSPILDRITSLIPSPYKEEPRQAPGAFVGTASDSRIHVAVVTDEAEAAVYVTDGKGVNEWLGGALDGGSLKLAGESLRLSASVSERSIEGELEVEDGSHRFEAAPAVEGETGVFRSEWTIDGTRFVRGWIVTGEAIRGATRDESDGSTLAGFSLTLEPDGKRDPSHTPFGTMTPRSAARCNELHHVYDDLQENAWPAAKTWQARYVIVIAANDMWQEAVSLGCGWAGTVP